MGGSILLGIQSQLLPSWLLDSFSKDPYALVVLLGLSCSGILPPRACLDKPVSSTDLLSDCSRAASYDEK